MKIENRQIILSLLFMALCSFANASSAEASPGRSSGSSSSGRGNHAENEVRGRENENEPTHTESNDDNPQSHQTGATGASSPTPASGAPGSTGTTSNPDVRKASASVAFRLSAIDPATKAKGRLERKVKNRRGALERDRLVVQVSLPVPSTVPAAATVDQAAALPLVIDFSRSGVLYAQCFPAPYRMTESPRGSKVEFKLDIESRVVNGASITRLRHGSCDTDLGTPGNENAIPAVVTGDNVTVSVGGGAPFIGK